MSKLVDGCILAFTECPYKKDCGTFAQSFCKHKGIKHEVVFSCAMARSYEIIAERK